ncbi:MarR family transcriptional regulator [Desulfopila aestuarii]|uniref:MarR family protein n=1 Tax=Desulfopila aestuarii DSM 18488 TaxID=1121416 RepID=A0A1M7YFY7_9BACT|nr:MarR family transcriptional regulator [Desulfopila aestuarii]SHO51530.1 MarR family protein [Desulfopila aestuarii DSM 18488]
MQDLPQKFEKYCFENLGVTLRLQPWDLESGLPYFLRDLYRLFKCELLSSPVLVMTARDEEDATPATIRKHISQLQKKWEHEVLYLAPSISTYNRKRLIEQKIAFVVPGNQMYLPTFGIDLREHVLQLRKAGTRKKFSPSTQVALFSMLYEWPAGGVTPSQLAERLGYTPMTMTRAFDEIEAAGLVTVGMEWRERVLRFEEDKKSVWEKSLQRLRSPVSKRVKVTGIVSLDSFLFAGESALARFSMLAEPSCPVVAVSKERWKAMLLTGSVTVLPMFEPEGTEIEVWKYPPELFARGEKVDPLSLYVSFTDTKDERIEIALETLSEAFPW